MIDFKNKKVLWICVGITAGVIIIVFVAFLWRNHVVDQKAAQAENDRIIAEEKAKSDLEALTITEATEATPVVTETPVLAPTPTTTKTTPTPVPTPAPTPTPDPGPQALTIIGTYTESGQELPKLSGTPGYEGYYMIDIIPDGAMKNFTMSYTPISNTAPEVTVESGTQFLEKISDMTYFFNSQAEAVIRIDLKDAAGEIKATGKFKITTGRG